MGQRADGFGNAWLGGHLNWDSLFGGGWQTAPKEWVSVWRECSPDELVRASQQGLAVPAPELRPPEVRQEMELLDSFRPEPVAKRGVSRLHSIFASPAPEDVPFLPHRRERLVVEMLINPAEAFVGDMDFITSLISFMWVNKFGVDQFHGAFRKYWDSIVRLDHFLGSYERIETPDGGHWMARRPVADHLPKTFFAPEIMITTPVISQRHIRLLREWASGV
jgi:hypothetical protein